MIHTGGTGRALPDTTDSLNGLIRDLRCGPGTLLDLTKNACVLEPDRYPSPNTGGMKSYNIADKLEITYPSDDWTMTVERSPPDGNRMWMLTHRDSSGLDVPLALTVEIHKGVRGMAPSTVNICWAGMDGKLTR